MFKYEKFLEFPVQISKPDLDYAKLLMAQVGGYAGELGAALRYFFQSSTMPTENGKLLLLEIATEELAHIEILCEMIKQLAQDNNINDIINSSYVSTFAEHKYGLYPTDASGVPFSVTVFASSGDYLADLVEDMAAEQKARAVYENLMDLTDNQEILAPLSFLRQREIIHFQRFSELYEIYKKEKFSK